jgi:tRNA A-37 threonylcarbamoyl transferase component Bud32
MNSTQRCKECGKQATELVDGVCPRCQSINAATLTPNPGGLDETLAPSNTVRSSGAFSGDFGEYELMEEVARGGMGVIYKARHRKLNRIAAVKMILRGRFSSDEELQRFHVEAEAAARLDHPGIVPVYEIGECEGQAFFAMKFIEGGSLAQQIERFRDQPRQAARLLAEVARAVHHAHQRGILHRDLKPANILIGENDQPLVTDLGLAKKTSGGSDLTNTGAVLGTPSYMPPEQAAGDSIVTTAADIYSLGAIMYELLTGVPPYKGATAVETVMQVLQGPPEAPSKKYAGVDRDLELICMKCLERDPEARYGSALELASDLDAWLLGDAISIKAPSFASLAGRWFRRNQKFVYIGFALLTGLLLTLPFALAFFGDNSDVADVYRHFPADQRPWLFSLGKVPKGLDIAAIAFLFLIFWPSIGLLNALVARPTTIRRAFGAGVLTALVLTGVLFLLMGWMVLLQGSVNATNDQIYVLAEAVWPPKGEQREQTLVRANQLYGGVEDIPHSDRAEIVADRIISDHFASVPTSMLILLGIGCAFSVPVTYGTMLGHLLLRRGHAFWLCAIRYAIAWYSISIAGLAMLVLPVSDFRGLLVIVATVCTAVAYVTVRRWRRREPVTSKESGRAFS